MSTHETTSRRLSPQSTLHIRAFDAPAETIRRAHLDAETFVTWMGPRGSSVTIARFDARTGGAFDYTVTAGGEDYRFRGSYHSVDAHEIVHTWQYVGDPTITLERLIFTDLADGGSELTVISTYATVAECDAMSGSDMGEGMAENFSRLDDVLAGGA